MSWVFESSDMVRVDLESKWVKVRLCLMTLNFWIKSGRVICELYWVMSIPYRMLMVVWCCFYPIDEHYWKIIYLTIMLSYNEIAELCWDVWFWEESLLWPYIDGIYVGSFVQRETIVVALYWICFRFREEPETSMEVRV